MQDLQVKKTCKICQKELKTGKIYCSKECYWKKSPRFKTNCRQCGKEFWTYPSFVKNGEGVFCCNKCKYIWISENYRGEKSKAGFRNAKINKICKWCNKEIITYKSQNRVFCNNNCYHNWFRKNRIGENAIRWIDGSSFLPYGIGFNRKLKREIKQRDNWTCKNCGTKEKLSVHHIDYDKNHNSEDNLITLCMVCNIKDIKINKHKYGSLPRNSGEK